MSRFYTNTHEWVQKDDGNMKCGITDYAQEQLGDVVYVELPSVGDTVTGGQVMGSIESVKAVSDVYSPLTGTIASVNEELENLPELVNQDPYGKGWLVSITPDNPDETGQMMNEESYSNYVAQEKENG